MPDRAAQPESPATDETIITPEMMEAGAGEYMAGDLDYDFPEEIAVKIFRAMERARRLTCLNRGHDQ